MIHGRCFVGPTPNPFTIIASAGDYTTTSGRTASTLAITPGENTGIFLVYGDSFGANSSPNAYAPASSKLDQISILDHVCYRQTDPVLGITNTGGCMLSRLGKKLIDSATFQRVIFINCCRGGASIADFILTGIHVDRLRVALSCSRLLTQPVTAILQIVGTNDSALSQATWEAHFATIRGMIRGYGIAAPIYVPKISYVSGANVSAIRAAQAAVISTDNAVKAGPDIDPPIIPAGERSGDALHPDDAGQDNFASLFHNILAADF